MYIVDYQKVRIFDDGIVDTSLSGNGTAFVECSFGEIEQKIDEFLNLSSPDKYLLFITQAKYCDGHLA